MINIAIEYQNVSKTYGNSMRESVKSVSLAVPENSFVTLLGASGSGKTTLLKLANRLIEPSGGRILFFGRDTAQLSAVGLRRQMGCVLQQGGLFPHMTVRKNIASLPEILKWDKRKTDARVDELLELVGLPPKEFQDRYPAQLSGGQAQRVSLARALAANPPVLLMDEPFGALDAITRQRLQDDLVRLQKLMPKTVLFVTHDVSEAFKLGDQIVVMNEGRVEQDAPATEIARSPASEYVRRLVTPGESRFAL